MVKAVAARIGAAWLASACALALAAAATAVDQGEVVLRFSPPVVPGSQPPGWEELRFRTVARPTRYTVVPDGEGYVLRAESEAAASALYQRLALDPKVYRILAWRWKVGNVLVKADARRRSGDDYPARVYVAFRYDPDAASAWERVRYGAIKLWYGQYPPRHVVNYVWDNRLPPGTALDNAYTDRAKIVVVRSGAALVDRWLDEERDVYLDYKRLFGAEPPPIEAIAVMTDTDDTGERAVAHYGPIALRPAR